MRVAPWLIFLLAANFLCYGHQVEVQGHRGCRGVLPENTLPAFAAAIEEGVDALEMDLLMTQDGHLVIYHDYFLNRRLCRYLDGRPIVGKVLIRDLSLAQIKEIDCGSKKNSAFPRQERLPGVQIPTLEEVFAVAKDENVMLNLEIKRSAKHPEYTFSSELLAQKVLEAVRRGGFESRVYYSSFDREVLGKVREMDPTASLGLLQSDTLEGIVEAATALKAEIVSPEHVLLQTPEDVKALQAAGFRVIPWTVNDPKRWQQLIEMGVDGIITDYPQDLIFFLSHGCDPQASDLQALPAAA